MLQALLSFVGRARGRVRGAARGAADVDERLRAAVHRQPGHADGHRGQQGHRRLVVAERHDDRTLAQPLGEAPQHPTPDVLSNGFLGAPC